MHEARAGQNLFKLNEDGLAGNGRCRADQAFHSSVVSLPQVAEPVEIVWCDGFAMWSR